MKPKVYLETTIPSYLTTRLSRDLVIAAHQELTIEWWTQHRHRFSLFVSPRVHEEAERGDEEAAGRRLAELAGIPIPDITSDATALAKRFLANKLFPLKAAEDAFHVAIATVNGMDYLLTWNCRHIANAEIMRGLADAAAELGYRLPALCTPNQLMGE